MMAIECGVAAIVILWSHLIDWSTPKGSLYRQYVCSRLCFPRVQLLIYIYIYIYMLIGIIISLNFFPLVFNILILHT